MRLCALYRRFPLGLVLFAIVAGGFSGAASAQASYEAQVRGAVTDQSGAAVVNASITITNDATNVAQVAHSNERGQYFLVGLRPAVYTIRAESSGFRIIEKKNIVLQVAQETTVDFVLQPLAVNESMEVTETAPLLDTESATLGTEISNEYIKEIPLLNRDFFGLTFLAAGQLSVRNKLHFQWTAQRDGRHPVGWHALERPGAGRGRKLQRLLRATSREPAGVQG